MNGGCAARVETLPVIDILGDGTVGESSVKLAALSPVGTGEWPVHNAPATKA